jgi:nucleoside phosphorylase
MQSRRYRAWFNQLLDWLIAQAEQFERKHNMTRRALELEEAHKVRPNTALPLSFFQQDMIVCTGEDPQELIRAIKAVFPGRRPRHHQYRCYQAWKLPGVTIVISGIGTGCIEPMMWELLDYKTLGAKVPKRLVMIGTAGYVSDSGFGQVYVVDGAYPAGCAVRIEDEKLPLRPEFDGLKEAVERLGLPTAEEVSTDRYFTCTPDNSDERKVFAKSFDRGLREELKKYWKPGRLISMETLQFYHFAHVFGLKTQYVALRGVANLADQFETQGEYSQQVLTDALRHAVSILRSTYVH